LQAREARLRWYGHGHNEGEKIRVVDIAEKVRKAKLRWYGNVIRDEGEPIRHHGMKISEDVGW
jgi:hypothetical protein